jgi:multidrug transporter EmrE-like cation transporter
MNLMEASVQFPLLSATVTVLTALFGAVFFREKLRAGTIVSLLLTVAGAVLVAVQPF